jgi:membrane protein involved in colicin uptake
VKPKAASTTPPKFLKQTPKPAVAAARKDVRQNIKANIAKKTGKPVTKAQVDKRVAAAVKPKTVAKPKAAAPKAKPAAKAAVKPAAKPVAKAAAKPAAKTAAKTVAEKKNCGINCCTENSGQAKGCIHHSSKGNSKACGREGSSQARYKTSCCSRSQRSSSGH